PLPYMTVPSSGRLLSAFLVSLCAVLLIGCFAVYFQDWWPQAHKKAHDRLPAVGFCRNSIHARQAPTAASLTTTTSRATCRMIINIGGNFNGIWERRQEPILGPLGPCNCNQQSSRLEPQTLTPS